MRQFLTFSLITLLCTSGLFAQAQAMRFHIQRDFRSPHSFFLNDTVYNKKKTKVITGASVGGVLLAGAYLIPAWYAKEDLTHFHFFNDNHEWLQLDKAGHTLGAYHASRWWIQGYKWAGMPKKRAIWQGGLMGFVGMSSIEVLDGFGKQWGASWGDIGANATGSGLAMLNQALWNEDRIQRKYSFRPSIYTRPDSVAKYGNVLGKNLQEWFLKDYNGQTQWLSLRVHSFLPEGKFKEHYPRWLNLAVGYGGTGMIGRYYNPNEPNAPHDPQAVIDAREYRQYYVAFDIDLSNIRTRSGILNAFFQTVSIFRIPLPALEMDKFGARMQIR